MSIGPVGVGTNAGWETRHSQSVGVIGLRQYGDAARRCRPVLLGSARLAFPLEGEPTINAHDFALLELSVVVDQLKDDYPGLTTGSFLV